MNIAVILQNSNSLYILQTLAKEYTEAKFDVFTACDFFNEEINKIRQKNIEYININLKKEVSGFYISNFFAKIKLIINLYKEISKMRFKKYNIIIYNNDGIFQRIMLSFISAKKIMISESILSGNEHNSRYHEIRVLILKHIYRIVGDKFSCFLPSYIGASSPNKIFVVSSFCKSYLLKNHVKKDVIDVIGFVKYNQFENSKKYHNSIIFIAQAFSWHGLNKFNNAMLDEINHWIVLCKKNDINFYIKLHPRNSISDFNTLNVNDDTYINDIYLNTSCIFVGLSSTLLLAMHNCKQNILISRFSCFFKRVSNSFYNSDFPVVNNINDGQKYLNDFKKCKIINFDNKFPFGNRLLLEKFSNIA